MNGFTGQAQAMAPGSMFVRALYDYDADDGTSLSFRRQDIIQVLTQLESGWWDGYFNGRRGWFPSNYCEIITDADDLVRESNGTGANGANGGAAGDEGESSQEESQDEYEDLEYNDANSEGDVRENAAHAADKPAGNGTNGRTHPEGSDQEEEESAFWIPQATPEGRLYYYNTLTGVTRMDLPLESLSSANESGPRDRNVYLPETTRPPPERMAAGYERDEDADYEASGSDAEMRARYRRENYNNGMGPNRSINGVVNASTAFTGQAVGGLMNPAGNGVIPPYLARQLLFDDEAAATPLTWNTLLENFRKAVERFRVTVETGRRAEMVARAEDISDHLRLLLAAGSGTTDNHSGSPSIISSNKALYPLFRETMSRFSKLVLSSHIAAADYPPLDAHAKCLKEAEGLLHAIYGFVEVARQQRGEDIPRLAPGFVSGSYSGGGWRNNGLTSSRGPGAPGVVDNYDPNGELDDPNTRLDQKLLERLDELHRMIDNSSRRLMEQLAIQDRLITPLRHKIIGDTICRQAGKLIDIYRPFLSTIESITLAPLGIGLSTDPQVRQLHDCKQAVYDYTSELLIACQAVGSPLADEWASSRGDALEDRMKALGACIRELETVTARLMGVVRNIADMMPADQFLDKVDHMQFQRDRSGSHSSLRQFEEGIIASEAAVRSGGTSKLEKIFGEVPTPLMQQQAVVEDIPEFLRLDYENEITYDPKFSPPMLKAGTLNGLVEQLTRHDRLDSEFNNTFLLTYRSFISASELFEMLVKRWSIQPPYGIPPEDYKVWEDKKQRLIRFRVVNILKSWFDQYWMEGNDDDSHRLMEQVMAFARDHVATTNTPGAAPLMTSIEQRLNGSGPPTKRLVLTLNTQTPQSILPKNMKKLKFLDIDAIEFARQLTIIESSKYGKIKPMECLNKTWQRKLGPEDADPAANIKALILHSNQLTNWVAQMILNQADVRRRVIVIKHFVSIADRCRGLNNFSTLTSIISALATAPIHRLSRTWNQVPGKTKDTLESMRKLMASYKNFAEYREELHRANPPCTPFLGVYLTDLTFIEDGIPSNLKKNNLINFFKRTKTAEVIRDIQQYQNVPYSLQPVPELQEYILNNMQSAGDVHEMYDTSLQVEPREREDEKIARLLSESGFL